MNRVWAVYFAYFAASLIMVLILTPLVRQLAFKLGAVDYGAGRRVHVGIVPRLGGVAVYLSFLAPVIFSLTRGYFDRFHWRLSSILIATTLVFLIGILDDFRHASIWLRLIAEAGAAGIVYSWGIRITALSNPLGGVFELGWLSLPVTILWIVIITNAVNLIDGLDGLATGTGILISVTLLALSFSRDAHINLVFIALIGALSGFLVYNFPPASIFLGDSGSLFIGFFLASFTIASSFKAQAMATMMVPLIAFAIPLMDMSYAVLRRYYRGIPLGKPDREHIHHKLLERGIGKTKAVLILYLINGFVMAFILFFVSSHVQLHYFILLGLFALAVAGLRLLGYLQFRAFFQANLRNFRINRKRRYINYLIRHFRQRCDSSCDPVEMRKALSTLFSEYGLQSVDLIPDGFEPQAMFRRDEATAGERIALSFPIQLLDGKASTVCMTRPIDEDGFLCSADLIEAVKRALERFSTLAEAERSGH